MAQNLEKATILHTFGVQGTLISDANPGFLTQVPRHFGCPRVASCNRRRYRPGFLGLG